jgi:hypothetical protein
VKPLRDRTLALGDSTDKITEGPVLLRTGEVSAVTWAEYARLEPGEYPAYCVWAKAYRDPNYQRWTCLVRFHIRSADLLHTLGCVPLWFALGDRAKPHAGRRSAYFREWINANGGPPMRGDRMSPRVFVRRMARVRVRDTKGAMPYSVIDEVLSWDTGHSASKSHSQGRLGGKAEE